MRTRRVSALSPSLAGARAAKGGGCGAPGGRTQPSCRFHVEMRLGRTSSRLAISCCDRVVPSTSRRASAFSAASAARLSARRSVRAKFDIGRVHSAPAAGSGGIGAGMVAAPFGRGA